MKIKSTQRHSTGAAHLGPGSGFMFRRGPLLEEVDAGGASGTANPEVTPPTQPATPAAPTTTSDPGTAPGGGSEKLLPQSQVNALVAAARREGREQALRDGQQAPQPPVSQPAKPETKQTVEEQIAELRAENREIRERARFEKEASRLQINDALSNKLFTLARAEGVTVEQFGEWLGETVTQLGIKPAPAPTAPASSATPSAPATPAPASPPPAAPAAPSPHSLPTANGVVDLFNLTPAQLRELGPQGVRKHLDQLWAIGNQMSGAPERPKPPSQR